MLVLRGGTYLVRARLALAEQLRAQLSLIESDVVTRALAIGDPAKAEEHTHAEGLRAAVHAALEYGIEGIESGESDPPAIPGALLEQARLAARANVGMDVVLRRHFAGHALLGDHLVAEAGRCDLLAGADLKSVLRCQAMLLDRLFVAVTEAYRSEAERRAVSTQALRVERVRRLLRGEMIDPGGLAYDLEGFHLGIVASGPGLPGSVTDLVSAIDCERLLVRPDGKTAWLWLGSRLEIDPEDVLPRISVGDPSLSFAFGEARMGLSGWRLTHRQAIAALPIAERSPSRCACYENVAVLASIRQDELAVASMRQTYLEPLMRAPDGGAALRRTLRAYFSAERNSTAASAILGITRQTVNNRLRNAEDRLRRPLGACAAELEIALELDQLASHFPAGNSSTRDLDTSAKRRLPGDVDTPTR